MPSANGTGAPPSPNMARIERRSPAMTDSAVHSMTTLEMIVVTCHGESTTRLSGSMIPSLEPLSTSPGSTLSTERSSRAKTAGLTPR